MEKVVVYIEDEPDMIEMVRITLESYGYSLLGAVGGEEGIDLVKRVKPDAVLLDLLMPEVDGWKVYRALKWDSDTEDIPIIVITAKEQPPGAIERQFQQGIEGYIVKPFGPYEIVEALEGILGEDQEPAEREEPASFEPSGTGDEKAEAGGGDESENAGVPRAGGSMDSRSNPGVSELPESVRVARGIRGREKGGVVRAVKRTISFFVAVIYLCRYAASFIPSSFRDKT